MYPPMCSYDTRDVTTSCVLPVPSCPLSPSLLPHSCDISRQCCHAIVMLSRKAYGKIKRMLKRYNFVKMQRKKGEDDAEWKFARKEGASSSQYSSTVQYRPTPYLAVPYQNMAAIPKHLRKYKVFMVVRGWGGPTTVRVRRYSR